MGKHLSKRLQSSSYLIMSSDEDQPIVIDIYVGFYISGELAIIADFHDYEEHEYNCSTAAIVNLDDSKKMARHHRIKHSCLPKFIAECMEEWGDIINPLCSQTRDCFKEITECLLDEGCRFKIFRTYGKDDYMCF